MEEPRHRAVVSARSVHNRLITNSITSSAGEYQAVIEVVGVCRQDYPGDTVD
jgi:hypothetical protein